MHRIFRAYSGKFRRKYLGAADRLRSVAGLTSSEAEGAIEGQLRQNNIVNDPQVSVFVKEYTNSGVSVAGEVIKPGSYSTLGPHRLFDVLQAAGGLTEKAPIGRLSHTAAAKIPSRLKSLKTPPK